MTKQTKLARHLIPVADCTPTQNANFVHRVAESKWKSWRTMRPNADRRFLKAVAKSNAHLCGA